MSSDFSSAIQAELAAMKPEQQRQVLEFARTLRATRGTPGMTLLKFAGRIPEDDLRQMQESIEHGCEQVDLNEW